MNSTNEQSSTENIPTNERGRVVIIRTSDMITFKQCRRKWKFSSHLMDNIGPMQHANPLWLGSAMHYALEDFHGIKRYATAALAIQAFAYAFDTSYPHKVPDDWRELLQLGIDMMVYYEKWLANRDELKTYMFNGHPQIEVNIKIPVAIDLLPKGHAQRIREYTDIKEIFYSMQLDRVHQDDNGLLWIMEYKSAKIMQTHHFATDPQCSRYVWGAEQVYPDGVAGVIYQQHRKQLPKPARVLLNGTVSVAENQATSWAAYRESCLQVYKEMDKVPKANKDFLAKLASEEDADGDNFIRRDRLYRNLTSSQNTAQHILKEIAEALDPELLIYPNHTRDCANMCAFYTPCVAMDDGSDYKGILNSLYEPRPEGYDGWRKDLPDPATFKGVKL